MLVLDCHCDTLTTARAIGSGLAGERTELSLLRPMGERWCQCFAIWLHDRVRGEAALAYYDRHRRYFAEQLAQYTRRVEQAVTPADIVDITSRGKTAALLTVENGSALGGRLERVAALAADGVRMMTLTWNAQNELAGGQESEAGFSPFGRSVVAAMEQHGIVADVSHLCETAFWELERFATRPYVASHSNCRAVHDHPRNLTDDQIRALAARGGIIGLTYHLPFVCGAADACFDDLCRHLEQLLRVGGGQVAALGSDFDGGTAPSCLCRSEQVANLADCLMERFGKPLAAQVLGGNALAFFERYQQKA